MRVLLLLTDRIRYSFPLGAAYIGGELLKNGHMVIPMNFNLKSPLITPIKEISTKISYISIEDMAKRINFLSPDIIAAETHPDTYPMLIKLVKEVKRINNSIKVILGGRQATVIAKESLEAFPEIDIVIKGDGVKTIVNLAEKLEEKKETFSTRGIVYRNQNKIIENKPRSAITSKEFNDLLEGMIKFRKKFVKEKTYGILTSLGCPFNCKFCVPYTFSTCKMRYRSAENIISELQFAMNETNAEGISFFDSTFGVNEKLTKSILFTMKKEQIDIPWFCQTHLKVLNSDILDTFMNCGINNIVIGVESGSERVIKAIRKHDFLINQVQSILKKVVSKMKTSESFWDKPYFSEGLSSGVVAAFIRGFPMEKEGDLQKTFNLVEWCVNNDITAQIQQYMALPGTALLKEYGTMDHLDENYIFYRAAKLYEPLILKYPKIFSIYLTKLKYLSWKKVEEMYDKTIQKIARKREIRHEKFYIEPIKKSS